ncbi:hypothetical protein DID76_00660 [Candidatus Marinamargulisbacteria bacterium SCGC AG-414-C22]|nr:hypothetical protein DID76_00660 [Candidatus Marinamargulisbacteria bacterium SCGC AG-414-C22]
MTKKVTIQKEFAIENIALNLILTFITCGIYNLFWNSRQMNLCNALANKQTFNFWLWFLLSILTCGIYHVFYQYKMATEIINFKKEQKLVVMDSLPILSVMLTLIGLSIIVDCIHQSELNDFLEKTR